MSLTSDIGGALSTQYLLQTLRGQLSDTQAQINSGKKSTNLSGMGTLGASQAVGYRATINVLDGYTENLNKAKAKLSVMDSTMSNITKDARETLNNLRSQIQGTTPYASILSGDSSNKLNSLFTQLNSKVNGQYLFSGDNYDSSTVSNAPAIDTNVGGLVSGFLSGTPSVTDIVNGARGVTGASLGYSAPALTAGAVSFRANNEMNIDYTVNGTQQGFADIARGLALIKNLPQPTTTSEQANYWTIVNGAMQLLDDGTRAVDAYQGVLGTKAAQVDNLLSENEIVKSSYEMFIGGVEDADMGEASTRLQSLQTQLQASYSIIAQMKSLSLVNFLR